jgi:hypothetical protein
LVITFLGMYRPIPVMLTGCKCIVSFTVLFIAVPSAALMAERRQVLLCDPLTVQFSVHCAINQHISQ